MHLGAITLAAQCSPILGFSSTQFETEDVSKGAKATKPSDAFGGNHLCWASAQLGLKLKMSATRPERPKDTEDEVKKPEGPLAKSPQTSLSIVFSIVLWLSARVPILKTEAAMT